MEINDASVFAAPEFQKKMKNLRTQFVTEKKKKPKSGSGVDDQKRRRYFDALQFLSDFTSTSCPSTINMPPESVSTFLLTVYIIIHQYGQ